MRSPATFSATVALMFGACARTDAPPAPVVVRDSAGVRIVENSSPAQPAGSWTISQSAVLDVGTADEPETESLYTVVGAVALQDGGVVVANRAAPMIRWFDADGAFAHGVGRSGDGPGEYRSIDALFTMPTDSVATWEHTPRRMRVYGPDGRLAREVVLDLPPDLLLHSYPSMVGHSRAGFVTFLPIAVIAGAETDPVGTIRRDTITYMVHQPDGSWAHALTRLPGFEIFVDEDEVRGSTYRTPHSFPFAKVPITRVAGERFYYGSQDRWEIDLYGFDGSLKGKIRSTKARQPVTAAARKADADAFLDASRNPTIRAGREKTLASVPYPDSLPAYRRLRVDRLGWLWVQEYSLPGDTNVDWSVFDPDGRWATDVQVPASWSIQDIGVDYILAVVADQLDVQHVMRFPLSR